VPQTDNIYNINVQGKRGNIAQVRNCVEYDFVPNNLTVFETDYLHFQWVGSDFNPLNNDGEGRAGTDRSNLVEIVDFFGYNQVMNYSQAQAQAQAQSFLPADLLDQFTYLGQLTENCFTEVELINQLQIKNTQSLRNCALLNNASVYFNSRLFKINVSDTINVTTNVNTTNVNTTNATNTTYRFMSTRNNNFSNRNQKGTITVLKALALVPPPPPFIIIPEKNTSPQPLKMPVIAIVFLSLFITAFVTLSSMYMYRNHSKLRKYMVRSMSASV
jgi:hypothetical protein